MKILSKTFSLAVVASTVALTSCDNGAFSSPLYLAVTITPRPSTVAQSGTVLLTAVVSNNLSLPTWSLLDATATTNAGTLTPVTAQPNSILYTAPPAPPIYNSTVPVAFTQGTVTVQVSVTPPSGSTLPVAHDSVTVFITSPTISTGISPTTVSVVLNGMQFFNGYAVGSLNNALTWQVNGVTGGSTATGTVDKTGIYTAPATMPMTGNTVTITAISQADPTKSSSAVITLQPA
jgi:hypothetical protein